MASSSTSTSDSPNNDYVFDIFISHRGPDVKKTLATHLYHRLCKHDLQVFLDEPEMRAGENITPQIESAIRTSTVQLVIFSPNFANSKWCLDELVLMVESMSNYKSTVIPVFYGVNPADLRWVKSGKGVYAQALCELETKNRYSDEELEKWKTALSAVAEIKGFEGKPYNCVTRGVLQCLEAVFKLCNLPVVFKAEQLLEDVVEAVLEKVKRRLYVSEYPKGLEEKLRDFETTMSLQQEDREVRVIGIAGLGGVGKTTLAKEFFNTRTSKYKRCCFLFDVRDKPLTTLQSDLLEKLIQSNMQIGSPDEGIEKLRRYLPSSDCLIIFDDVDDIKQLEALLLPAKNALKSNSLILVTSRNKDVLIRSQIPEMPIYTLKGLDREHSRELFCWHAFSKPHPAVGFDEVVNKFLDSCRGLPLSLKVLGSLLRGKNDLDHWEAQFRKISNMLPDDIQGRLKISYDCLDEQEKKMFLDIACFFRGEDRDRVIRILNGSGWEGSLGLWKLESRCLVEMDSENRLRMHDHVRDVGRSLAENDCELRLWNPTDHNLFHKLSRQLPVRGISLVDENECEQFLENLEQSLENLAEPARTSLLSNMSRLQLVKAEGCSVERLFSVCQQLPHLIYLHWRKCPNSSIPFSIPTKNLRVLHIEGKILETLWQHESQKPLLLRELYISAPLLNVPDFIGNMQHLEKLVLRKSHLETVPDELFDKQALKHVEFQYCKKLKLLPDRVVKLKGLQSMILSGCCSLQNIPDWVGNLAGLQHLDLSSCSSLQRLPDSIGNLAGLQHLDLSFCRASLQRLPDSIGNLAGLQHLDLSASSSLLRLPDSIGNLAGLQHLNLRFCSSLQRLPDSIGNLAGLQHLNLCNCSSLQTLPDSIGNLAGLQHLRLRCCSLQRLPDSIGNLAGLQLLDLTGSSLQRLPDSIGNLAGLQHLNLHGCSLQRLPDSIGNLAGLQHLDLHGCHSLQRLPDSIGILAGLQHLDLGWCYALQRLPDSIGNLAGLQHLKLSCCSSLQTLPDSIGNLAGLQHLNLNGCSSLQKLPDSIGNLAGLQRLDLTGCSALQTLPDSIGNLAGLQNLKLRLCSSLQTFPDSIGNLAGLQYLDLNWCRSLERLPDSIGNLAGLQYLDLTWCSALQTLPDSVGKLTSLQCLVLWACETLQSLPDSIGGLRNLQTLDLGCCSNLEMVPNVEHLSSLEKLDVFNCSKLQWGGGVVEQLRQRLGEGFIEKKAGFNEESNDEIWE